MVSILLLTIYFFVFILLTRDIFRYNMILTLSIHLAFFCKKFIYDASHYYEILCH